MSSSISGTSGAGHFPPEPIKPPETDLNQLDAINTFTNLIKELTFLASESKLGGGNHD